MESVDLPHDCDRSRLLPELARVFVALPPGPERAAFVREAYAQRHGALRFVAFKMLRRIMTDDDTYGWLGMYRMHLLSWAQWRLLLPEAALSGAGRFLDVGAGRGDATADLAARMATYQATEPSIPLARALRRRGARLVDVDLCRSPWPTHGEVFDVITCLNVLDRVSHPFTLSFAVQSPVELARSEGAVRAGPPGRPPLHA